MSPAQPEKSLSRTQSHTLCFQAMPHSQLQPIWQFVLKACGMLPPGSRSWPGRTGWVQHPTSHLIPGQTERNKRDQWR